MKHWIHPLAEAEFADAVDHYSNINPALGARFYNEIKRLIEDVCAAPERYWRFDPPVRRHLSAEFPYSVVYLEEPDGLSIIAIMEMHREPGYWRERLSS